MAPGEAEVRCGSISALWRRPPNVRFAPESGQIAGISTGPSRATSGCEQSQQNRSLTAEPNYRRIGRRSSAVRRPYDGWVGSDYL
jgi:hypothetical protein